MAAMKAAILCVPFLLGAACAPTGTIAAVHGTGATPLPITAAAIIPQGTELRLDIVELTCHSCAGQVALGTSRIPGVLRVSAEMLEHTLVVRYDPTLLTESALIAAIDRVVDAVVD
jgi:hypothetical protein